MKQRIPRRERVYVKVNSDFDATGYMQPRTITWSDGRVFRIDAVQDFRPAAAQHGGASADCYTIVIHGEIKYLYFENTLRLQSGSVGRWYVERVV